VPTADSISGWTFKGYKAGSDDANATVTFSSTGSSTPVYRVWPYNRAIYSRTLTIKYDGNSGSGTVANQTGTQYYNSGYQGSGTVSSVTFTLSSNAFTKSGYTFTKWTEGSTSGTEYSADESYTFAPGVSSSASKTMYAKWSENTYTINYDLAGGKTGTNAPTSATYDSVVTISNPTRSGYAFTGWTVTSGLNTSTAKYGTSSSSVTSSLSSSSTKITAQYFKNLTAENNGSVTLTANWEIVNKPIRIYYNMYGGSYSGTSNLTYSGDYIACNSKSLSAITSNGYLANCDSDNKYYDYWNVDTVSDLKDYNYSYWIKITKSNKYAPSDKQWWAYIDNNSDNDWITLSQSKKYSYDDLVQYAEEKDDYYKLVVYVYWHTITYNCNYRSKYKISTGSWSCTCGSTHTTAYRHYCCSSTGTCYTKSEWSSLVVYDYVCPVWNDYTPIS